MLRNRLFKIIAFVVVGVGVCATLPVLFLAVIPGDVVSSTVIGIVEQQTGGRLTIESTEVGPWHGLSFYGVEFLAEPGGQALFSAKKVRVGVRLLSLYFLNLRVDGLYVDEPQIALRQVEGRWNFQPILEFRKKQYPPSSAIDRAEEETEPLLFSQLIPGLMFLPIKVDLSEIGWKKLGVKVFHSPDQEFSLHGLDFLAAIEAWGMSSELRVEVSGEGDANQIRWAVGEKVRVVSSVESLLQIDDLRRITFRGKYRTLETPPTMQALRSLSGQASVEIHLDPSTRTIHITKIDGAVADFLRQNLVGAISFPHDRLTSFKVDLREDFQLDLEKLGAIVGSFLPKTSLGGRVAIEESTLQGELDIENFDPQQINGPLPNLALHMSMEDVSFKSKEYGVDLSPINASLELGTRSVSSGVALDFASSLYAPQIRYKNSNEKQEIAVKMGELRASSQGQFVYPDLSVPSFTSKVEISGMGLKINEAEIDSIAMNARMSATSAPGLENLDIDAAMEMPQLVDAKMKVVCNKLCLKSRLEVGYKIGSLGQLYSLAETQLRSKLPLQYVPKKVSGAVTSNLKVTSSLPNYDVSDIETFLESSSIDYDLALKVSDFAIQVPFYGISLEGYQNTSAVKGSLAACSFDLNHGFQSIRAEIPQPNSGPTAIATTGFEQSFQVGWKKHPGFSYLELTRNFDIDWQTEASLRKIESPKLLPLPIKGLAAGLKGGVQKLEKVQLSEVGLKVPQFGFSLASSAMAKLSKEFFPESFATKVSVEANSEKATEEVAVAQTNGKLAANVEVSSESMRVLTVSGESKMEAFDLTIPGKTAENPIFLLRGANGIVPFDQRIELTKLPLPPFVREALKLPSAAATKASIAQQEINVAQVAEEYLNRTKDVLSERQNKIVEVDYQGVRSFFGNRKPISIAQVEAAGISVTDFESDVELRQNWLAVNHFGFSVLEGKVDGSFQLAFDPLPQVIKTSIHMTRLNSRRLLDAYPDLARRYPAESFSTEPYLDGTVHLRMDLKSSDMNGGVEFTTIGKDQLKMVLSFLDPKQKNPSVSLVKQALKVGDVNLVRMPIKNGEVGVDVDLTAFGVPLPVPEVRRIPISQVIEGYKKQFLVAAEPQVNQL